LSGPLHLCLAIFTFKLWSATIRIVKGGEVNARRELRAYIGHMPSGGAHFNGYTEKGSNGEIEVISKGVKYFDWNYGKTPANPKTGETNTMTLHGRTHLAPLLLALLVGAAACGGSTMAAPSAAAALA